MEWYWILAIVWYSLGVVGALIASKWDEDDGGGYGINIIDVFASITVGGVCGVLMLAIGLNEYSSNSSESLLKRKFFKTKTPKP